MNLCVFQGTFNPVHNAHVRVAQYITEKYNFDKFLFIPAYKPPHKDYDPQMSYHRLGMVKLAISGKNPKFEVSDIEFQREGKSYTYITICELYKKYNHTDKIKFVIGTDAFAHIESWYEADKLKELVKFLVFYRGKNIDKKSFEELAAKGYDFEFEELPFEDISSTNLRRMIKNGQDISNYVDEKVKDYIYGHGLYEN
ncbi:MAG TPA: nicotinate (nicotinamide) nucleotide adenylyltransferase [Cyanobacteria bacterium UBA11991]|nr:nicotinate (nicotinamide) nucleotide adenylyltransferase [Cyanobacteria bacterium UBA11991]